MLTETAKATGRLLNLVAYRKQVKGDALLERAVADLVAKGEDELRAHIIVINTFCD
jgi:hypothetical protein